MDTTKLSTKGQVILPKTIRDAHGWDAGTEFSVEETPGGVVLRALKSPPSRFEDLAGCLRYMGRAKSLRQMDNAISKEAVRASALFRTKDIWLAKTVLLETEWVLRGLYRLAGDQLFAALRGLIALPNVQVGDPGAVLKALKWSKSGLDFAGGKLRRKP